MVKGKIEKVVMGGGGGDGHGKMMKSADKK